MLLGVLRDDGRNRPFTVRLTVFPNVGPNRQKIGNDLSDIRIIDIGQLFGSLHGYTVLRYLFEPQIGESPSAIILESSRLEEDRKLGAVAAALRLR